MRAGEWDEIKRIFEAALRLAEPERSDYLSAACKDIPDLRGTVEELLQAHEEASGFLRDTALTARTDPVFETGQIVADRFRIVRLISRGGMGEVYEAFDQRLSICLALKTIRAEFARDKATLERFRREISLTRDIGHPNLCRIHELVEHQQKSQDGSPVGPVISCLTMQLLEGETLQQYLERVGPLSPKTALPLVRQISEALKTLHLNNIVHRDLKPSNIMVAPGPEGNLRAIVMDFGLAKPFGTDTESFESQSVAHMGTPFYMAPELFRGERPSPASDIYALGLIIDGMLISKRPFSGTSFEALLYEKLWGDPVSPNTRRPDLPDCWSHVILKCISREAGDRYADSIEILRDLESERQLETTQFAPRARTPIGGKRPTATRSGPRWRSRPLIATASGVFSLLLAAGVALGFRSTPTTSVLVFPFENWTGNKDYDYLCKGTTSETIRRLVEIPSLDVSQYYEPHTSVPHLVPRARFSIDGHLQADKENARLTVQVSESSTGRIAWSQNFDTSLVDSLEIQNQIASGAVQAMRNSVFVDASARTTHPYQAPYTLFRPLWSLVYAAEKPAPAPTKSVSAMEAYMRGLSLWNDASLLALREADREYKRALEEDPNFALAYAGLSAAQFSMIEYGEESRDLLLREAGIYAKKAVEKGPELPESYTALAAFHQYNLSWREADSDFRHAIELGPRFARAHRWYAGFLMQFGRNDEGLKEARESIRLDPYDYAGRYTFGYYLYLAGQPKEAQTYVQETLAEKDIPYGHNPLGYAFAAQALTANGKKREDYLDSALHEADIVARAERGGLSADAPGLAVPMYALFYAMKRNRPEAERNLGKLLDGQKRGLASPEDIAVAYVALGNSSAALETLERAVDAKDSGLLYIKVNPFLAPLRSEPRFQNVISRLRL